MKRYFLFLLSLAVLFSSVQGLSQTNQKAYSDDQVTFIENKGQVTDQSGNSRRDIQFKVPGNGVSVFVGNGKLYYQFHKLETKQKQFNKHPNGFAEVPDTTPARYEMYRLDMALQGTNPHPEVIASEKHAYYENYHTTSLHTDSSFLRTYGRITYKNIYPHIDWTLYIKNNKLEYDFIVHPGGDVTDIKIKYNGATNIAQANGDIQLTTPMGRVTEQHLYTYEKESNTPVISHFALNENTISFKVNDYAGTLVIDPTLAWSAYFGGANRDVAWSNACDNIGNVFICGLTKSVNNIATTGAYQTIYNGGEDAFLAKYNSSGSVLWSTYYGGESQDIANGIVCDNIGNVYVTGTTFSTTNIATSGSHQTVLMGSNDAFLAKFNGVGELQWATYYGGNIGTQAGGITCDNLNNIYISGYTASNYNISTAHSYQDTLGGNGNAYLTKFNERGDIIWGTYFGLNTGGSGALNCACDKEENVYITGMVDDTGIYTTPDCYKSSNGYGNHSFLAKFDSSCHLKWSTYFGGDSADFAYGVTCDDSSNVYITGLTNSANGIASPGAHQTSLGGGESDAFLAKFTATGALQWSTYYGGTSVDAGNGVAFDGVGNIWLTGYTFSTSGIATTDGYQVAGAGSSDGFIARFSEAGELSWGSYYGGNSTDEGTSIATNGTGTIYFTGYTASPHNIATLNFYPDSVTDSFHAFLVKLDTGATAINVMTPTAKTVQVHPNPNNGNFWVHGEFDNLANIGTILIMNEDGVLVYKANAQIQNGILNKKIKLQTTQGVYILKVLSGNEQRAIKFLIDSK